MSSKVIFHKNWKKVGPKIQNVYLCMKKLQGAQKSENGQSKQIRNKQMSLNIEFTNIIKADIGKSANMAKSANICKHWQTLATHWPNIGQTSTKHWPNIGQLVQTFANSVPNV